MLESGKKILEKSGKLVSPKMWEPWNNKVQMNLILWKMNNKRIA